MKTGKKSLTNAQKSLLAEVIETGDMTVHEDYAPAKALIAAGLITGKHEKYGRIRLKPVKKE